MAFALAACTATPPYKPPAVAAGERFKEAARWQPAKPGQAEVDPSWWRLFQDPVLDGLQAQVLVNNETLKASAAQYQAALATLSSAQASLYPTLNLNGGVSRSANALASAKGTSYSTSGSLASWELDLWGRLSTTADAANAKVTASLDDVAAARLSVQSTLAQSYFLLRNAEAQGALLQRTLAAYERALALTRERYRAGVASSADVAQAQVQLEATRVQAIEAQSSRAQLEHALAVLLGQVPAQFSLGVTAQLPTIPAVPEQLPSALLQRRPDIAAAERRVAAANASIGAAQAAFFPALTLSANAGYRSSEWASLISASNQFWSLGPSLALAVFDGGSRQAAVGSARASADQAAASYRQTVLTAFQEVEDNLVILARLRQEGQAQTQALQAAQANLNTVTQQYRAGTVNYLSVVAAQTSALASERSQLDLHNRQLAAANLLLKNLAGRP